LDEMWIIEVLLVIIIFILGVLFLQLYHWKEKGQMEEEPTVVFQKADSYDKELSMDGEEEISARMISLRTGKTAVIQKSQWYIGKSEEFNDYVITDNKAISRRHACILWQEGRFYIMDLESLNGTFVNGIEVLSKRKVELRDRDKIILADEVFEFQK
jgi:hypothetical protein